jgi:hypothetical protein
VRHVRDGRAASRLPVGLLTARKREKGVTGFFERPVDAIGPL